MSQETPGGPSGLPPEGPRYEPPRYGRRERREKNEEKRSEKSEKSRGEKSLDEKWRRDPVNIGTWAAVLIWAGLCVLAETTGWGPSTFSWWETWAVALVGAGVIFIIGVLIRLAVPEYRRSIAGGLILGLVLLGVGLQELSDWSGGALAAFILIAIGLIIILGGIFRRRR